MKSDLNESEDEETNLKITLDELIEDEYESRRTRQVRAQDKRRRFGKDRRLGRGRKRGRVYRSTYRGEWSDEEYDDYDYDDRPRRRRPPPRRKGKNFETAGGRKRREERERERAHSRSYSPSPTPEDKDDDLTKEQVLGMSLDDYSRRKEIKKRRTNIIPKSTKNALMIEKAQDSESDEEDLGAVSGLLIILRGMPGVGKTTFARAILDTYKSENVAICGDDNHYYTSGIQDVGCYDTDIYEGEVKKRCIKDLRQKFSQQKQMIVLDGVHPLRRDYRDARLLAKKYNYGVVIFRMDAEEYRPNEIKDHLRSSYEFSDDKKEKKVINKFEPWTSEAISKIVDVEPPEEDEEMNDTDFPPFQGKGAYVTLVMRGTDYVLGALNLAHSLRLSGTNMDIICMITDDVRDAQPALEVLFDEVIYVDYIKAECRPLKTKKQREKYSNWICDSFTKWHCLNLKKYDKVLFLDADVITLDNLDHLFNLPAPAGTFSSPWARGKHSGKDSGRALKSVLNDHYHGPPEFFGHGKKVSWTSLRNGLENSGFVAPGTCVLLEPNTIAFNTYKRMLKDIVAEDGPYGFSSCYSGFDEQSIIELYWRYFEREQHQWTHIDQTYNFIPWHFKWITGTPKVLHFFGKNVWEMERTEWTDIQVWWNLFESIFRGGYFSNEQKQKIAKHLTPHQKELTEKGRPMMKCFWCEAKKLDDKHQTVDPETGKVVCPILLPTVTVADTYTEPSNRSTLTAMQNEDDDAIDYGI